jgi:hypothetical protein
LSTLKADLGIFFALYGLHFFQPFIAGIPDAKMFLLRCVGQRCSLTRFTSNVSRRMLWRSWSAITTTPLLFLGRPMASRTRIALFSLDASIPVFLSASLALGCMSVAFDLSQQLTMHMRAFNKERATRWVLYQIYICYHLLHQSRSTSWTTHTVIHQRNSTLGSLTNSYHEFNPLSSLILLLRTGLYAYLALDAMCSALTGWG